MKSVFDELKDSNQQIYAFFNDALYFKSSFWLTHTVTHTGKRADGTNGRKSAGEHGVPDKRGHKRSGKQKTSSFQSVGKDEVSGSNSDSSSTKPALFVWKGRFCFAFRNFLACLKFAIRPLTTEQATDRKIRAPAVLSRRALCFSASLCLCFHGSDLLLHLPD